MSRGRDNASSKAWVGNTCPLRFPDLGSMQGKVSLKEKGTSRLDNNVKYHAFFDSYVYDSAIDAPRFVSG